MLDEHASGRGHVGVMAARLERAAAGDRDALAAFVKHAAALDDLLREHIAKEDGVLFPMADELLEGAPAEALLADFRRIECEAGGRRHQEWVVRVGDLCRVCSLEPLGAAQLPTLAREFL
jgi:hemerythrin-like domain-containing protein